MAAAGASGVPYGFPTRPLVNLLEFFQTDFPELGITEQDFKNPSRERWEKIFTVLVAGLVNTNPDNLHHPPMQSQLTFDLEFPDLHEDAISLFNLSQAMKRVLHAMGHENPAGPKDNFTMKDILNPEPKRLMRICSAFTNFVQFAQDRLTVYENIKQENDAVIEQRNVLEREIDELQKKLNTIRAARAEQQPEIKKLQGHIDELKGQWEGLQNTAALLKNTLDEKKGTVAERRTEMAGLKEKIAAAKEEGNRLSGQIVQSPDRMKSEMDRMHRQLDQLRQEKEERRLRLAELRKKSQLQQQREEDCDNAHKLITGIKKHIDTEKQILREVAQVREQATSKRDSIRELESKGQQRLRMVGSKQEKLDKLTMQHNYKMADKKATLEQLQQEKENLLSVQSAESEEKKQVLEERRRLVEKDSALAQAHSQNMGRLREKYSGLLKQLDAYHLELGKSWQGVQQSLDQLDKSR